MLYNVLLGILKDTYNVLRDLYALAAQSYAFLLIYVHILVLIYIF